MEDLTYDEARRRAQFRAAINDLLSAVEAVTATEAVHAARVFGGMEQAILETAWHDLNGWLDRYHAALAESAAPGGTETAPRPGASDS